MPVPKRKRSRARRDSRFANKHQYEGAVTLCLQCSEPIRPHVACLKCGYYKGEKLFATKGERVIKRTELRAKKKQKQSNQNVPAE